MLKRVPHRFPPSPPRHLKRRALWPGTLSILSESRGYAPILPLPLLHALHGEQEVGISLHVRAHVNHAGGADELPGIDLVNAVFGQIFAAYPMDGRVKMRPGMLAGLKAVPVPGGAAIVIPGNFPQAELRRVGPLRWQRQQWS